jgi:hypothetical protein
MKADKKPNEEWKFPSLTIDDPALTLSAVLQALEVYKARADYIVQVYSVNKAVDEKGSQGWEFSHFDDPTWQSGEDQMVRLNIQRSYITGNEDVRPMDVPRRWMEKFDECIDQINSTAQEEGEVFKKKREIVQRRIEQQRSANSEVSEVAILRNLMHKYPEIVRSEFGGNDV